MTNSTVRKYPEFIVTKTYRRFEEFCNACHKEKYIGLCYGPPGVGKTLSARYYTKRHIMEDQAVISFEHFPDELTTCRSILITPSITTTPRLLLSDIGKSEVHLNYVVSFAQYDLGVPLDQRKIADYCELIIVDEADRLKTESIEALREIYDQRDLGLILIGMPGFEKRLSRYPQLYSRIGFAHHYTTLSNAETQFILETHGKKLGIEFRFDDFTAKEALAAIIRITQGNFRLINRMLRQIERILDINDLNHINKEVVEAARECLVIGSY
ncbi:MAG: AAA family ATPase [Cytophagales bacterium]|nr:AAA family ATPase [Cytophagales bacterium]